MRLLSIDHDEAEGVCVAVVDESLNGGSLPPHVRELIQSYVWAHDFVGTLMVVDPDGAKSLVKLAREERELEAMLRKGRDCAAGLN